MIDFGILFNDAGELGTCYGAARSDRTEPRPKSTFKGLSDKRRLLDYDVVRPGDQHGIVPEERVRDNLIAVDDLVETSTTSILGVPRRLPHVTVVPYKDRGSDWYSCCVVASEDPRYPVGGYHLAIPKSELLEATPLGLKG